MAKTLKDIIKTTKPAEPYSKHSGSAGDNAFIRKHSVEKTGDANGNDDEVFNASKVKPVDRKSQKYGYTSETDKTVYEAAYSAKAGKAGKDLGKPGKNFEKIAKEAGKRYGSKESGENVAGAVLKKIRQKHMKEALDPVGHEDEDINNNGVKNDSSDEYLKNRRKAIGKAMNKRPMKEEVLYATAEKMFGGK